MSWAHLEDNPPWFVRCMARRKVHAKVVVAMSDEELAISSGIPIARFQAIYHQRTWDSVPMREIRAFCSACGFDPFSFKSRNRYHAYKAAVRAGRCAGFTYLKKSPWWTTVFAPLLREVHHAV